MEKTNRVQRLINKAEGYWKGVILLLAVITTVLSIVNTYLNSYVQPFHVTDQRLEAAEEATKKELDEYKKKQDELMSKLATKEQVQELSTYVHLLVDKGLK